MLTPRGSSSGPRGSSSRRENPSAADEERRKRREEEERKRKKDEERKRREEAKRKASVEEEKRKKAEAEVDNLRLEKRKIVAGFPGMVQKFIHFPEFLKPLTGPYDACIRLGRHQACCKFLAEVSGFDKEVLGDFYNEQASALLKAETDRMFLDSYPFLSTLSAQADESSDALLSLEPAPRE